VTLTVTHLMESAAAPSSDPAKVGGPDWNADHVVVGGIQSATVTLSSAQLLDLHNTEVTIVPSPGAGHYLVLHRVSSYYTFGSVEYSGDPPLLRNGDGQRATITSDISLSNDSVYETAPANDYLSDGAGVVDRAATAYVLTPITDGDGTLTVTVWYSVEDVPA
jgi:hypothetical protein